MAQILRTEKIKYLHKIAGSSIPLFENLSFSVEEKEWMHIVIAHGGGKTTLYKILLSQLKPTMGKILYSNKEKMDEYDRNKYITENITAVPEYPTFVEEFTVKDWTRFQIELLRPKGYKKNMKTYFEFLKENDIDLEKHLSQLSLLELRKIEISFSILSDTILIIGDDISVGLSKDELEDLANFLKGINKTKAIITISSDPYFSRFAKTVVRLS